MREIVLVIRREFRERVASRSFVLGTLSLPALMLALILLPPLFASRGTERTVALVNEGPQGAGDTFAAALTEPPASPDENRYHVVRVDGSAAETRETLAARVEAKEIDGFIVLPADVLAGGKVQFRARNVGSFAVLRDLRRAASRAVQTERIRAAGIDPASVAALIAPVEIEEGRITAAGEERRGHASTFLTAYVAAFLVYLMVTLYGVGVMRSVLEEKTNRIAEVLMSTIRAPHLVVGKIAGVGAAAMTQVLLWMALGAAVLSQSARFGGRFSVPDEVLQALDVPLATAVLLLVFFLLGFFIYASIFAIVGAAVTSEQEAQSVQFIALVPLIAPILYLRSILDAPLGRAATIMGLFPLTSPVAMPMRMATVPIPAAEIAAAIALLIACIALLSWTAGKVYRVGMLSTGKRPTLAELARWLRAA